MNLADVAGYILSLTYSSLCFVFYNPFKNVKTLLSLQAVQEDAKGCSPPTLVVISNSKTVPPTVLLSLKAN